MAPGGRKSSPAGTGIETAMATVRVGKSIENWALCSTSAVPAGAKPA